MATQSVSYVKAHLAEVINRVKESHDPIMVTQNGECTVVIQDHEAYQRTRQALAMMKLISMGEQDIAKRRTVSQHEVFRSLKRRLRSKIDKQAGNGIKQK